MISFKHPKFIRFHNFDETTGTVIGEWLFVGMVSTKENNITLVICAYIYKRRQSWQHQWHNLYKIK